MSREKGNEAELLAIPYLQEKGYSILGQNVQLGKSEIDIIASKKDELIFVEVKARSSDYYGEPQQFVTKSKQTFLLRGATMYIEKNNWKGETRFDVLSVLLHPNHPPKIEHFENAFQARW